MRIRSLSLILVFSLALASCTPSKTESLPLSPGANSSEKVSPVATESSSSLGNPPVATEIPPNPSPVITEKPSEPTKIAPFPSPVIKDGLQKKLTQLAIDDLALRLNTSAAGISVILVEATTWLDAGLGCPTDKVYAPSKVSGFRIRLKAVGQVYVYHTDNVDQVMLCPETNPGEPGLR